MQFSNHRSRAARGSIVYLAVDAIAPSAVQPRQNFSPAQLEELSRSIAEYGVLSPLTVRPRQGGYELVAGERRLRAARMAGLSEVPCIVMELDLEEASFIALVENLQRNDLDFLEESRGIAQLIRLFGLSQEECARRLGKSQSAVANKLRLLRLPEDVLNAMRNAGLTERHGRALLRLETPAEQREALAYILSRDLNVAATDAYIERLLEAKTAPESEQQKTFILKDVRVFLNTISHSLDLMKQGGIDAGMRRQETDEALILTINIPKARSARVPRLGHVGQNGGGGRNESCSPWAPVTLDGAGAFLFGAALIASPPLHRPAPAALQPHRASPTGQSAHRRSALRRR